MGRYADGGNARTWFTPKQKAELWERWKSGQCVAARSIDAVTRLIETELPGWWWTCGYCSLSNDASLYAPGSESYPYASARMAPDFRSGPEALRLLQDPEWGEVFDDGFHRDRRGGTVPLAMLAVFLEAKIALANYATGARNP